MIAIDPIPNSKNHVLSPPSLARFFRQACTAVGLKGEVDVMLTSDNTLRELNRKFRGKNKPTDVLSFPAPAEISDQHAGDLAISLETAARQAATYGHTLRDEVRILLLHGLLHLSGLDHETDNGRMATREATLRRELRLPATLIDRSTTPVPKKHSSTTKKARTTTQEPSSSTKKRVPTPQKSPFSAQKPPQPSPKSAHASPKPSQSRPKSAQPVRNPSRPNPALDRPNPAPARSNPAPAPTPSRRGSQ
jgi:probable rRNA maturation factor